MSATTRRPPAGEPGDAATADESVHLNDTSSHQDHLAAALAYAAAGIPVFPLHTSRPDGTCDCGRDCGRDNGKHPRTRHGLNDATTDPATIRRWWSMWPAANIGARTGIVHWVLDIDPERGGEDSLASLEAEYGAIPGTWAVETGGGGLHLWFRLPDGVEVRNSAGRLGPGLDVRGDGGYVVAPPSLHASGRRYAWAAAWHPDRVPLAEAPAWLVELVTRSGRPAMAAPVAAGEPIPEGRRNATLTSLAGTMRRRGFSEDAILHALLAENAARCRPPLPEDEVARIARSVARYAPAPAEPRLVLDGTATGASAPKMLIPPLRRSSPEDDHLRENLSILGANERLSEADGARPGLTVIATVEAKSVRWLWPDRIPLGKLAIIDGDPGLGKSLLTLDLAARVTRGAAMPDGTRSDLDGPAGVLLMSAEDDLADTIRPRLEAAGADLSRVAALTDVPRVVETTEGFTVRRDVPTVEDIDAITRAIGEFGAALVIIDPLMAFMPGTINSFRDQDVRRALAPLAAMAAATGATVLIVRHLNKNVGGSAIYRGGGSIGIIGAARAGLLVGRDPDDPERRIVAMTKNNLGREATSLAYRIEATEAGIPRVEWLGETEHTAAAILAAAADGDEGRSAIEEAKAFLRETLTPAPMMAREVLRLARAAGITEATLRRAKAALGVRAERTGGLGDSGAWAWKLPDSATIACLPSAAAGPAKMLNDPPKMITKPLRCSSLDNERLSEDMSTLASNGADPAANGRAPADAGNGGMRQFAESSRVCVECGDPLPAEWPALYCERHGGRRVMTETQPAG